MLKKMGSAAGGAKVTFILSSQPQADHVHVVGDFNDWQASTPMKRQKDGSWKATLDLEPGREYQFRYLVDGNVWVNDEAADAYVPNPFGADNCVLRMEAAPASNGRKATSGAGAARASGGSGRGGAASRPAGGAKAGGRAPGGKASAAGKPGGGRSGGGKSGGKKNGSGGKGGGGQRS